MISQATITCPACGSKKLEDMAPCFSEREYTCAQCQKKLVVQEKECCVFCVYSDQFCPPQQDRRNGCCA